MVQSKRVETEARPSMARVVAARAVSTGAVIGVLALLLAWIAFLVWLTAVAIIWLWSWF